jgi:hypothetical protein
MCTHVTTHTIGRLTSNFYMTFLTCDKRGDIIGEQTGYTQTSNGPSRLYKIYYILCNDCLDYLNT